jgi:hypothetical protein|tara:strand:+ start:251 stop:469 length:219 start_codon:yes stop_codon:yes gene_type:complete
MDNELTPQQEVRLECMKLAVEYGTQRDLLHPEKLADIYYKWIMQDSSKTSPQDNRIDDSLKSAKNSRSVRKG